VRPESFEVNSLIDGAKIPGMRKYLSSLAVHISAMLCFIALANTAMTQAAASDDSEATEVVLTKLFPLIYPLLSRQAHITGDVIIRVWIRQNGTVASADVLSGHPMLKAAALASAQGSTFECRRCSQELTAYSLTYTFGLRDDVDCSAKHLRSVKCLYLWKCGGWRNAETRSTAVTQSQGHIKILADAVCLETSTADSSGG